jgi:HSP20 family protein
MKTKNLLISRPSNIFDMMFDDFSTINLPSFFKNSFIDENFLASPAINIAELDDKYVAELSIPGFNKDNVKLEIENDILKITGNYTNDNEIKKENYHSKQFSQRNFKEYLQLSDNVDKDNISAEFKNGILKINILKKEKVEKISKVIDIN